MKAKLLSDAGDIAEGEAVEIKSSVGIMTLGRTGTWGDEYYSAPVYEVRTPRTHREGGHARPSGIALIGIANRCINPPT